MVDNVHSLYYSQCEWILLDNVRVTPIITRHSEIKEQDRSQPVLPNLRSCCFLVVVSPLCNLEACHVMVHKAIVGTEIEISDTTGERRCF